MLLTALPQYSFTIWDWDETWQNFERFTRQVDVLAEYGFNVLELGVRWADCEQQEGVFDFSRVEQRVSYALSKNLKIRLRLNMVDYPSWYSAELYQMSDGSSFPHWRPNPSVFNENNRKKQLRFAEAVAQFFSGRGFCYTPGFSVHMEVKFGDWNTYEPSARAAFRQWLAGRYANIENLNNQWGTSYGSFVEIEPPLPKVTSGQPDLNPVVNDWITFREEKLTDWVNAFCVCIRRADPTAKISVPLGESFRREAAAFANLAYWNYSRMADEIVFSYDFFWHGPTGLKAVRTSVATMVGITQKPTIFEIDGPYLLEKFGYSRDSLVIAAQYAMEAGAAGIQVTNWGSCELSKERWMGDIAGLIRARALLDDTSSSKSPEVLYYVSKWQQYVYREPTDWIYDRQFSFWHRLNEEGLSVRIISDENLLTEDIGALYLVLPFNMVITDRIRDRIRQLSYGMRVIADEVPGVYTPTRQTVGNFGAKVEVTGIPFSLDTREVQEILGPPLSKTLRVAVVQFRSTRNISENTTRMIQFIKSAAGQNANVVVFPEMALTGYTKSSSFRHEIDMAQIHSAIQDLCETCKQFRIYAVIGAPSEDGEQLFCSAYAIGPNGEILDLYEKIYLAGEQWASPGRQITIFEIEGIRCATFICHDERYPMLVQLRALAGAQVFFYISCESGLEEEYKLDPYRAQIQARAVENEVYIVHANTPAFESTDKDLLCSHGNSRILAPDGNLLGELGTHEEAMLIRDINPSYAAKRGRKAALSVGPLADWMKNGLELVHDNMTSPHLDGENNK